MDNNGNIAEKELGIQDYLDLVLRRRWIIIIVFIIVFGSTLYYNLSRPPEFLSESTFAIETQDIGFGSMGDHQLTKSARPLGFYKALIESRTFRDKVISQAETDKNLSNQVDVSDDELYQILVDNLVLAESKNSGLMVLSVQAKNPMVAYRLAAIATDIFKIRCQEIEQEESHNVVSFVTNQILVAQKKLEQAEKDLQEFKEKTNINISTGTDNGGIIKRLTELENSLAEIETERELAQANLDAYSSRLQQFRGKNVQEPTETESPEIHKLKKEWEALEEEKSKLMDQFKPDAPQIVTLDEKINLKKNALIDATLEASQNTRPDDLVDQSLWERIRENRITEELNLYTLKNRERYYRKLIENYRKKHPKMLEHAIEMSRLQRSKAVYENLYTFLVERGEEAKIKAATGTGGIRIVDPAVVPKQSIPVKMARNLLLGCFIGLGLGLGLAFTQEYFDNSIRTQDDITRFLNTPVMGVVPLIKHKNGKLDAHATTSSKNRHSNQFNFSGSNGNGVFEAANLITSLRSKDPICDNYRSLRTNLQFSNVDSPVDTILITSSSPGEGKTLTSANLAISFAELGKKTLILDCDLRKPKQHTLFDIEKSPGLSDYLAKGIPLDQTIYQTHAANLKLIPSGTIPPNPAEMLASQKMSDLLIELKNRFDIIIVDSPPLIAVTDPVLLSAKLSNVLLVIKFASTNKLLAAEAIDKLRRTRANLLGVVLNSTQFSRGYGYYYRYRYYRYNYHYETDTTDKRQSI